MAETTRTCPTCNKDISNFPLDIRNCPYCGTKLEISPLFYSIYEEQRTTKPKPSSLWYLLPLFFGVIGGIIGYVAVKDEDRDMANYLFIFGVISSIFAIIIILWISTSLII